MFFNCVRVTAKCLQRVNQSNTYCITPVIRMQNYSDWHHRRPSRIVNEEVILDHVEQAGGPLEFIGGEDRRNQDDRKYGRDRRSGDDRKYTDDRRSGDNRKYKRSHGNRGEKKWLEHEADKKPLGDVDGRKPMQMRPKPKPKLIKKNLKITPNDSRLREDGSLNVTELQETDPTLTSLMMSVRSKKKREKNDRIILEGRRLIEDAIRSGAIPEIIVFSRTADVSELPLPDKGVKLYKVPYRSIQTWSTLVTPPGLMGFFQIPDVERIQPAADSLPLTIICDNVRDPGNLGSILRAAAAVGCKKLITLIGCVDIWDPKVLKSAAGCHFRLPIFPAKTWNDIPKLTDSFANIYVADNNTFDPAECANQEDETAGIKVIDAESIVEEEEVDGNMEEEEEVDENTEKEEIDTIKTVKLAKHRTNYQRLAESKVAKELTSRIPVIPYYSTNYTENENIIILGGETLGLSMEALNMVNEKYGVRVNIPMTNGVDSLNTGMALGIIAFEIKRQHAIANHKTET